MPCLRYFNFPCFLFNVKISAFQTVLYTNILDLQLYKLLELLSINTNEFCKLHYIYPESAIQTMHIPKGHAAATHTSLGSKTLSELIVENSKLFALGSHSRRMFDHVIHALEPFCCMIMYSCSRNFLLYDHVIHDLEP